MKIVKIFLIVLFLVIWTFEVRATAQTPDKIIFQDEVYMLYSNPLESYFEKHPEKRPEGGIISTALWRGYVATFEIQNSELIVKDIEIEVPKTNGNQGYSWKSVISEVFPEEADRRMSWVNSILILPYGKMINYVHMGYSSTFSDYILIEVQQGRVNEYRMFDYKQFVKFKEQQFEHFKTTDEYQKLVDDLRKENKYDDEFIERFLRNYVTDYTSGFLEE